MSLNVKVVAILVARPGKAGELRTLLDGMVAPSRAEPGNLRYDLWLDRTEPDRFVLDELYTDDEAFLDHRATRHFQAYLSAIDDLAQRTALSLDPVTVAPPPTHDSDAWRSGERRRVARRLHTPGEAR